MNQETWTNPDGSTVTFWRGIGASIGKGASIGDNARIGDNVSIGTYARIGEYASIGKNAYIDIGARIGEYASIGESASIGIGASIGTDAHIGEGASIGRGARIGDDASVSSGNRFLYPVTLAPLEGYGWTVTATPDRIAVGCEAHSVAFWRDADDATINDMDPRALEFWKKYRGVILALAEAAPTQQVKGE